MLSVEVAMLPTIIIVVNTIIIDTNDVRFLISYDIYYKDLMNTVIFALNSLFYYKVPNIFFILSLYL